MVTRPGIDIQTTIKTSLLQNNSSGSAFIIATANWGTENTLETYEGGSIISSVFKTGALPVASNMFVAGRGRTISTYRFVPDDAVASTTTLAGASGDALDLTGKYKGTYGNNVWVKVEAVDTTKRKVTISDDKKIEVYDNDGAGYSDNEDIETDINASSTLVTAVEGAGTLVAVASKTLLTGGDNGTGITVSDVQDIIDAQFDLSYDALLVPEITSDSDQGLIANQMELRESTYKEYSVYFTGITKDEAYATTIARTASTTVGRMVILAPGTYEYNDVQYSGAYGACYYAGLYLTNPLAEALTNKPFNLTKYINGSNETVNYNNAQVQNLLDLGFTVINKVGNIQAPIRAVTKITDTTSPFFEQSIRRSIDVIQRNLVDNLNPFIGQKNTSLKRVQMEGVINSYLNRQVQDEVLNSYQSEVVNTTTPTEVSVNLILNPVYPINNIIVNLTI